MIETNFKQQKASDSPMSLRSLEYPEFDGSESIEPPCTTQILNPKNIPMNKISPFAKTSSTNSTQLVHDVSLANEKTKRDSQSKRIIGDRAKESKEFKNHQDRKESNANIVDDSIVKK